MLAPPDALQGVLLYETQEETSALLGYSHDRGISLYITTKGLKITMVCQFIVRHYSQE